MSDRAPLTHSYSSIKMYENCPKRYLHERINKDVVFEGSEATRYGERVHSDLENRLQNAVPLPEESKKHEELCVSLIELTKDAELLAERPLCLNANLTPTTWRASDAWLRSILDVLIIKDESAIVIKHYPHIKTVKSSLVWLKENKLDCKTYKSNDTNLMWADLLARIEKINQSYITGNFPAKPSGLCPWCPAKNICEYAQI